MEVCWRAGGGAPATSFDVRYSRQPITAAVFDDATVTTRVAFTGARRPYIEGERVCQLVRGLYIETGYYFAVRAAADEPAAPLATEPTS